MNIQVCILYIWCWYIQNNPPKITPINISSPFLKISRYYILMFLVHCWRYLTSTWLFHSTFCNVTKETKWSRPFLTNVLKLQKSSSSSVQYSTLFAEIIVFLNVACLAYHWAKHDKIFYTKPIPCDKMLIGVYFQHNLSWTLIICFRYKFSVYFFIVVLCTYFAINLGEKWYFYW